ncbi:unnamed protein product [Heterobilharzia americana]|nr:unnamed protein product [Heterobilharzia americana]
MIHTYSENSKTGQPSIHFQPWSSSLPESNNLHNNSTPKIIDSETFVMHRERFLNAYEESQNNLEAYLANNICIRPFDLCPHTLPMHLPTLNDYHSSEHIGYHASQMDTKFINRFSDYSTDKTSHTAINTGINNNFLCDSVNDTRHSQTKSNFMQAGLNLSNHLKSTEYRQKQQGKSTAAENDPNQINNMLGPYSLQDNNVVTDEDSKRESKPPSASLNLSPYAAHHFHLYKENHNSFAKFTEVTKTTAESNMSACTQSHISNDQFSSYAFHQQKRNNFLVPYSINSPIGEKSLVYNNIKHSTPMNPMLCYQPQQLQSHHNKNFDMINSNKF